MTENTESIQTSALTARRLTPPGRGAVAVILVTPRSAAGTGALDAFFQNVSGRKASTAPLNRILYGRWNAEDVVVVRVSAQRWEVHCHGGDAAVSRILQDLESWAPAAKDSPVSCESSDAESQFSEPVDGTEPRQLTSHDTTQTPSRQLTETLVRQLNAELIQCRTLTTAQYLLTQREGVLLSFLRELLTAENTDQARALCEPVVARRRFAVHLTKPWIVTIAGQPNAGKSSLLNALLGYERAIVFDQPGTTRDRIDAETVLNGWPFQFQDTAGIRSSADDDIESIGIETAHAALAECDACLLVVDGVVGWTEDDQRLLDLIQHERPVCVIWNKADLLPSADSSEGHPTRSGVREIHARNNMTPPDDISVIGTSAVQQEGIGSIAEWLCQELPGTPPPVDEALPVPDRVFEMLQSFLMSSDHRRLQTMIESMLCED